MIDHLIHIFKKGMKPFQSLSVLSNKDAIKIMQELYIEEAVFWERFKNPTQHSQMRRQTEKWLRQEFIAKGGIPQESYPIYMILGRTKWLIEAADKKSLSTTAEIHVPIFLFHKHDLSFTYPDSMVSFVLMSQKESSYYLPDYHGNFLRWTKYRQLLN